MRFLFVPLGLSALAVGVSPREADASRYVRFGVQDDAWLAASRGRRHCSR